MNERAEDRLANEIEGAVRRVREVQRKRLLVSILVLGVASVIIVGGEGLILALLANVSSGRVPILIFAIPFAVGLPVAWTIRTALWPKDPIL